jgi:hypothetical protein
MVLICNHMSYRSDSTHTGCQLTKPSGKKSPLTLFGWTSSRRFSIAEDRNQFLHGTTCKEAMAKAREWILERVHAIHRTPPPQKKKKLASHYSSIHKNPLNERLCRNTKDFQRHMEHQWQVTIIIDSQRNRGQLMLQQSFQKVHNKFVEYKRKFSP